MIDEAKRGGYANLIARINVLVDAPVAERNGIGPGDELFAIGLFSLRVGTQRNIPIVRSGILAAMPYDSEPFTKDGHPYHAYLAEMRSIGGLSGSPVFIFMGLPGNLWVKSWTTGKPSQGKTKKQKQR